MGFRLANLNERAILIDGENYFDLEKHSDFGTDVMEAVARCDELHAVAASLSDATPDGSVADVTLGPCVPRPSKVFGVGLNYRAHAEETGSQIPTIPMVFTKFPSCLVGPTTDIQIRSKDVDWEVELVVVIGRGGHDISEADAWSHVAGYTNGQDVSDRAVQMATTPAQFSLGKSYDTFGPIGPAVVSLDLVPDKENLAIQCDVSGECKQDSRTDDLIFTVPQIIAYLSSITTLVPGDLIFTGTPSGVGMATGTYLKDGDEVVTRIEGLGEMRNKVVQIEAGVANL